tara:strand:- start:479 stop:697 length:219 start_codon:yes stop_codon:yes gene_type:complete
MNYVVTEPGLTSLCHSQKLNSQNYALAQQVFGSDAFIAVPYNRQLQQKLRASEKYITLYTQKQLTRELQTYV